MALAEYVAEVLSDSPRAYWKLDEASGLPQDSSGNGLHMTTNTGTLLYRQPGPMSSAAILYNGGTGSSRSTVTTVTDNFSIETWIKTPLLTLDNQRGVYNGNSSADGWGFLVDMSLKFKALAGGVSFLSASAAALSTTEFKHVVIQRSGTVWTYYVNGVEDTANAGTSTPNAPGAADSSIHLDGFMQAVYAHVAIYETALGAVKVADHYAAAIAPPSTARDLSIFREHHGRSTSW